MINENETMFGNCLTMSDLSMKNELDSVVNLTNPIFKFYRKNTHITHNQFNQVDKMQQTSTISHLIYKIKPKRKSYELQRKSLQKPNLSWLSYYCYSHSNIWAQ